MTLPIHQALLIIGVSAVATFLTRALPFLLFPPHKKTPAFILYLGKVLPFAIMGMLVVYCLRGTTFVQIGNWLPQAISVALVVALHVWKKNTLLSIIAGTACYMALVQVVF